MTPTARLYGQNLDPAEWHKHTCGHRCHCCAPKGNPCLKCSRDRWARDHAALLGVKAS